MGNIISRPFYEVFCEAQAMMVDLHGQCDWTWDHLEDSPLGIHELFLLRKKTHTEWE